MSANQEHGICFSFIVPIFNVEKYISRCIDSLVSQTYKNIEIILIDDGSTDESYNISYEYSVKDDRIKLFRKKNEGLSITRNLGIEKSTGDYIIFVDSDDYIESETCLKLIELLDKCGTFPEIISGQIIKHIGEEIIYKSNASRPNILLDTRIFLEEEIKMKNYIVPAVKYIVKKAFIVNNNIKFKQGILHEDELYTPILLLSSKSIIAFNYYFYHHMVRENSITTSVNKTKNAMSIFEICRELNSYLCSIEMKNSLRKKLNDRIVDIYIRGIYYYYISNNDKYKIDFKLISELSSSMKNNIRILLLKLNPNIIKYLIRV